MSFAWGMVATLSAALMFGSQFVLLKDLYLGDGMVYQFLVCVGILMMGFVDNIIAGFPTFYPLAMLGGSILAIGNLLMAVIFQTIGIAPGLLIWTSSQMLIGWASGRFGWFGLKKEVPKSELLNYLGVAVCVVGGIFFLFIRNSKLEDVQSPTGRIEPEGAEQPEPTEKTHITSIPEETNTDTQILSCIPQRLRKPMGIVASLFAGLAYGLMFDPVIYIQDNPQIYPNASKQGIPYGFAFTVGSFQTSAVALLIYLLYKLIRKQQPYVNRRLFLPTIASGILWGCAFSCWMYANYALSEAITTPMLTRLPGAITALYGIFWYREIRGLRNYLIVGVGTVIVVVGSILTSLSSVIET